MVAGDRIRLLEVFQYLLENAVKYMGDQPSPRVEVGARRDPEETVFFVRDNGLGVEPAYDAVGFGLGLALVKR